MGLRKCCKSWRKRARRTKQTYRANGHVSQMVNLFWKMANQKFGIVGNATNPLLKEACFWCTPAQEIPTDLINVVTVHRNLHILTSCARMLSFILGKSHSNVDSARAHLLEPPLWIITCARILARGHSHVRNATRHFHKHRNSANTRDHSMTVTLENLLSSSIHHRNLPL